GGRGGGPLAAVPPRRCAAQSRTVPDCSALRSLLLGPAFVPALRTFRPCVRSAPRTAVWCQHRRGGAAGPAVLSRCRLVVPDSPRGAGLLRSADRRRVGRPVRQPAGPGGRGRVLATDRPEAGQGGRREPRP